MVRINVIIPVIRPQKARRCIEHIYKNAGIDPGRFEIVSEVDENRIGCPKMTNYLVEKAEGEIIVFLGDDCIPEKNFLKIALEYRDKLPGGWGMVGFRDVGGLIDGYIPCHFMADKRLLPYLDGKFFHEGYRHLFCDHELMLRCNELGRYIYGNRAKVFHDNPLVRGLPSSVAHDKMWLEMIRHDAALFNRRREADWPLEE